LWLILRKVLKNLKLSCIARSQSNTTAFVPEIRSLQLTLKIFSIKIEYNKNVKFKEIYKIPYNFLLLEFLLFVKNNIFNVSLFRRD